MNQPGYFVFKTPTTAVLKTFWQFLSGDFVFELVQETLMACGSYKMKYQNQRNVHVDLEIIKHRQNSECR